MLVFIKGADQKEIDTKATKIREFCNTLRNEEKDDLIISTDTDADYHGREEI